MAQDWDFSHNHEQNWLAARETDVTKVLPNSQRVWDLPAQTAADQTRLTWARVIESYEAVPPAYRTFFEPFCAEEQIFPHTLIVPTYDGFLHRPTEQIICDLGDELCVLKKQGTRFESRCYPLDAITFVEMRTSLLTSSIKISGITKQGEPAVSVFEFNSITDPLFTPIVDRIRCTARASRIGAQAMDQHLEKEPFSQWSRLNFKFMNYARRSVPDGDTVIDTILQSEIRTHLFTLLGKPIYRMTTFTHAHILTDRELIIIREDEKLTGKGRYGGIWTYIPLDKIADLSLSARDRDLILFTIRLRPGECIEQLFQATKEAEIARMMGQFKKLMES
jgi:hypothetical protein